MSTVLVRGSVVDASLPWDLLDEEERRRAARRSDPTPYLTAHALLRTLVAEHLGGSPGGLSFERRCATCGSTRHGKPTIEGRPDLHVSLSYGQQLAVAALSWDGPIGVDVEQLRAADFEGFARVTLVREEAEALEGLAGRALLHARCRLWARKEAILKATGHGLAIDPTRVVVSGVEEPAALVEWRADEPLPLWPAVADVALDDDHEVAVACLADGALSVTVA